MGRPRWILLTVIILASCAALGGVGLSLALRQTQATVELQMSALRVESRRLSERIQATFRQRIGEALTAAAGAYETADGWEPAAATGDPGWMEAWFVLEGPHVAVHPPAPDPPPQELAIETAPIWFLEAQQVEFREGQLELATGMYRRCTGPATPPMWQRRSWLAVARCQRKLEQYDAALATYDRLMPAEGETTGNAADSSEALSVTLAAVDTLIDGGRGDDAFRRLQSLVEQVELDRVTLRDEADAELVLLRLSRVEQPASADASTLRDRLFDLAARRGEAGRFRELVSGLARARSIPPAGSLRADSVHFIQDTLSPMPYLLAYRQHRRRDGEPVVIGVKLDLGQVPATFVEPLLAEDDTKRIVLLSESKEERASDSAWTEPLAPLLPSLSLTPSPEFTAELRSAARQQRMVYAGATLLMAVVLLVTVFMSVHAVRRELETARLRSDFVANVSHELKTPLALIRLFGETLLLDRVKDQAKAHRYYEIITRESERLTHLIDNILDFSRIQTGRKEYARGTCDVGEIVRTTFSAYTFQLDHQEMTHELTVEPDLPPVEADPDAIAQSVLNLINNAVKYSPEEKFVGVYVSALPERRGVLIEVRDRGIGIDPQEQTRLFEPFYRSADERVRRRRGSGLGLSLVQHMVNAHGGRISVQSTPGQGSTFRIELPA